MEVIEEAQLIVFNPTQFLIRYPGIAVIPSSKVTVSSLSLL